MVAIVANRPITDQFKRRLERHPSELPVELVISKATVLKFFQKARSLNQAHAHFRTRRYVGTDMLVCDKRRDDRLTELIVKLEGKGFFNKSGGLIVTVKGEHAFDHPSAFTEDVCA